MERSKERNRLVSMLFQSDGRKKKLNIPTGKQRKQVGIVGEIERSQSPLLECDLWILCGLRCSLADDLAIGLTHSSW